MVEMMLPDYHGNSLVNLMSSILHGFGGRSKYKVTDPALVKEIKLAKNVVLLLIDGMGADIVTKLKKENKNSFLAKNYCRNLTSVFPSTTTAAITTSFTGQAPAEHGLVAWYMYLKEFKDIIAILPFHNKEHKPANRKVKFEYPLSIFNKIKTETHVIINKSFYLIPYNEHLCKKSVQWGIRNFGGLLTKIETAVKYSDNRKYIYAYWGEYDSFCHHHGKESPKSWKHLRELDAKLGILAKKLKGTDTLLLITADHGHISTSEKRTIILDKHAHFMECQEIPTGGEPRALFCYVLPHKKQQFEQYVKHHLQKYCVLHTTKELVDKGYFGLFKPHPQLLSRIGDYVLILKENYAFKEHPPEKKKELHIGNHGGVSKEEMTVPLVKVRL